MFMKQFRTDDGSISYRKTYESEPYHTKSGAITEAFEKHSRALKVWEKKNPVIFDVCSGLAYSAACALEDIRAHENDSLVVIYLFENDIDILNKCLELPDVIEYIHSGKPAKMYCYKFFKDAIRDYIERGINVYETKNLKIFIIYGDFRLEIFSVKAKADFIFYAPFSPKITPEMWTSEVFRLLFDHLKDDGKLSTYAYARSVRDGLSLTGFKLENGPILGRRSPSVIAIK